MLTHVVIEVVLILPSKSVEMYLCSSACAINVNTCSNRSSVNTAIKVSGDVFVLECMRYVMVEFFKSERRKNNLLIIISEAEVLEQEKNIHTIIVYPITHNKTCKVKSVWKFHL